MNEELKTKLLPDAEVLLKMLSRLIDDRMLREIAEADYGDDADLHFGALRAIRDDAQVPVPLEWHPREVLELIRWSDPEDPEVQPGGTGQTGHVMRAFCCAALLRAAAEQGNQEFLDGENQTLAQLLASLDELGDQFQAAALRFLVWRLHRMAKEEEERPFFVLGILLLCLKVRRDLTPEEIGHIVQSLIEEEQALRSSDWAVLPEERSQWLLGLTLFKT